MWDTQMSSCVRLPFRPLTRRAAVWHSSEPCVNAGEQHRVSPDIELRTIYTSRVATIDIVTELSAHRQSVKLAGREHMLHTREDLAAALQL
jgi:hypothetical protein